MLPGSLPGPHWQPQWPGLTAVLGMKLQVVPAAQVPPHWPVTGLAPQLCGGGAQRHWLVSGSSPHTELGSVVQGPPHWCDAGFRAHPDSIPWQMQSVPVALRTHLAFWSTHEPPQVPLDALMPQGGGGGVAQ